MGKYIDAEKLKAEIERLNSLVSYESKDRHDEGLHDAYKAVKNVIASLQQEQPEVDLEKDIDVCWQNWISPSNQSSVEGVLPKSEFSMYARHFYELGRLNARKKEVDLNVDETEKDSLNKLIAKCHEGRDCKAAWEFYTNAKTEDAIKEK